VSIPRVAFFTDSFHEVNGVALTSREFARFAQQKDHPFLSVHAGPRTCGWADGCFETFELKNSRFVLELDTNLLFDLLFFRHYVRLRRKLQEFRADLVHVTGPGHCGLLGAILAHSLGVPLVASWHTNLHEFAGRRLDKLLTGFPLTVRSRAANIAEAGALSLTLQFYRLARVLFAPNPELVDLLATRTGRPTHLMLRGIDTQLFAPAHRDRSDDEFTIGYVGRLSPEKNVRLLAEIERGLIAAGLRNYRFLAIGDGSERAWLATHMQRCETPGILRGIELARAYAGMDAFVFPSETDTFGNVVLEAMASGVPAIVRAVGGPKYLVQNGINGFQALNADDFAASLLALTRNPALRNEMAANARQHALAFSWNGVFEGVYKHYEQALASGLLSSPKRISRARSVASTLA